MRIDLIFFIFMFFYADVTPANKLENTRWQGNINAPVQMNAVLEFRNDSSFIWVNNTIIETMHYTVAADTLTLTRLDGSIPCGGNKGVYRFSTNNNLLKIIPVNNTCHQWVAACDAQGYKRQ